MRRTCFIWGIHANRDWESATEDGNIRRQSTEGRETVEIGTWVSCALPARFGRVSQTHSGRYHDATQCATALTANILLKTCSSDNHFLWLYIPGYSWAFMVGGCCLIAEEATFILSMLFHKSTSRLGKPLIYRYKSTSVSNSEEHLMDENTLLLSELLLSTHKAA